MPSTYDQLLSSARNQKELYDASAKDYIPQMCKALEKENPSLTKEDIRDRIKKDCVQLWSLRWIIESLPSEYKDESKDHRSKADALLHHNVTEKGSLLKEIKKGVIEVAEKIGSEFDDEETEILRKADKITASHPFPSPETEPSKGADNLGLSDSNAEGQEGQSMLDQILRKNIELETTLKQLTMEKHSDATRISNLEQQIAVLKNQPKAATKPADGEVSQMTHEQLEDEVLQLRDAVKKMHMFHTGTDVSKNAYTADLQLQVDKYKELAEQNGIRAEKAERAQEELAIALNNVLEGKATEISSSSKPETHTTTIKFDGPKLFGTIFKHREKVLELVHNGAEVTEVRLPK
jgi:hypothetical protein